MMTVILHILYTALFVVVVYPFHTTEPSQAVLRWHGYASTNKISGSAQYGLAQHSSVKWALQ